MRTQAPAIRPTTAGRTPLREARVGVRAQALSLVADGERHEEGKQILPLQVNGTAARRQAES
ncbi:MAG: hypothetical protein ACYC3S_14585 [Chloroflexota bacterium]